MATAIYFRDEIRDFLPLIGESGLEIQEFTSALASPQIRPAFHPEIGLTLDLPFGLSGDGKSKKGKTKDEDTPDTVGKTNKDIGGNSVSDNGDDTIGESLDDALDTAWDYIVAGSETFLGLRNPWDTDD